MHSVEKKKTNKNKKKLLLMIPPAANSTQRLFYLVSTFRSSIHSGLIFCLTKRFPIFLGAGKTILNTSIALMIAFKKNYSIFILFNSCPLPDTLKEFLGVPGLALFEPYLLAILCHRSFFPHKIIHWQITLMA